MAAPVGCTLLFHGQKCCTWYVSRKLRFSHYISRTLFFRMTYMPRKPVTNLNAFQKSGEVFNDLWLHTTAPLLNNDVKSCDRNIIPNRTQTKNPSFELGFRILQVVLILWTRLTCSEYDIQTSRTIRVNRFPFWHASYFPSQNAYLQNIFEFRATRYPGDLTCLHVGHGLRGRCFRIQDFHFPEPPKCYFQRAGASKLCIFWES